MLARTAAGLASCLFALTIGAAQVARAEAPSGAIYVTTLPSGADIWVDGTYVGRAPVLIDALLAGHHALTVTKTGWTVREVDVSVAAGGIALSSLRLASAARGTPAAATGSFSVRGAPAGGSLSLDGRPTRLGAGETASLPPGPHRIVLTTQRGRITRTFGVLPDTTTQVVLQESPRGDAPSAVAVPAEDYLPTDAFTLRGAKIVVRYAGHVVVAHLGEASLRLDGVPVVYDSAPESISGKLYLPLQLLEKLTDDTSKAR